MNSFKITDVGHERVVQCGSQEYRTPYSEKLIQLLIERKGIDRLPQYLTHKNIRSEYLKPLFTHLNATEKNLKVLEVGCSSGHITEFLNEQPSIGEIYTFDVDKKFVDITELKKEELVLNKVVDIKHLTNQQSLNLPYENNFFDLIIVLAVVEHLPFDNRHLYVDEYYRKLKIGGRIGFWDTPNRYYPIETHSIGLPFVHWLPPQLAYLYAKLFKRKKMKHTTFSEFCRPGGGWKNSSYYELLPRSLMMDVEDVTWEMGYQYCRRIQKFAANFFDCPHTFFSPYLNVVFKKVHDLENPEQLSASTTSK